MTKTYSENLKNAICDGIARRAIDDEKGSHVFVAYLRMTAAEYGCADEMEGFLFDKNGNSSCARHDKLCAKYIPDRTGRVNAFLDKYQA